ncbi:MAG TPA: 1,4-alpha-glucan branching enzyme [Verrucomicrobia bacterium]|nr:MAG: 1,4-alpha-glucan branching enzyme [Lentisphaerae bacterium GWF2_57_35]HBA83851.1 1,4-alpha-glucan branching enzyme [Verrucomicrobiota bacterium]
MKPMLSDEAVLAIVQSTHGAPYAVFGMHEMGSGTPGVVVRTFQPYAERAEIIEKESGQALPMERIHQDGLYELFLPGRGKFAYRLRMTGPDHHQWETEDPYCFPLQISDFDLYLFGEGTHYRTYEKMGAHPMTIDGVSGVHFAVWAPNAIRVSVIGWFNRWDGRHHPMQNRGSSGLWEIFIPSLQPGDLYKFEIKGQNDYLAQKADPYAFAAELRPRSASVVWDLNKYQWQDQEWVDRRKTTSWFEKPIAVYEVHLSSWRRVPEDQNRCMTYRELADTLVPYVKKLGYTHIEMLPISEHPFDGSWGYQTIGYYAPTSRYGTPDDFRYFVDKCHQAGIGVLVDWVPAHFPKDGHGLAYFDGTHLYEHADSRKGEHKDWGTLVFNYGRNEVRTFLLSNAMYWAEVYHIDGLRVDAVAAMLYLDYSRKDGEWIPNQYGGREDLDAVSFLKKFNEIIHQDYPGFITFAEESTAWPMVSRPTYLGGLGFDFKWNMGWMHDTLEYMCKDPVFRKFHHHEITFSMIYAFSENFILPFSHDEVVHGKASMLSKMPGDMWQQFANLRLLYAYMYAHPGKKLLFMGGEFGQWNEWNFQESLDWHLLQYESHQKLQQLVAELNRLYKDNPSLHEIDFSWEGFEWIDLNDWEQSILSFIRKGKNPQDFVVCVFNFTPVPRDNYRVGTSLPGQYELILNTDSDLFGGSNMLNNCVVNSEPTPWQGKHHSIPLNLPPLGAVLFRYIKPQ